MSATPSLACNAGPTRLTSRRPTAPSLWACIRTRTQARRRGRSSRCVACFRHNSVVGVVGSKWGGELPHSFVRKVMPASTDYPESIRGICTGWDVRPSVTIWYVCSVMRTAAAVLVVDCCRVLSSAPREVSLRLPIPRAETSTWYLFSRGCRWNEICLEIAAHQVPRRHPSVETAYPVDTKYEVRTNERCCHHHRKRCAAQSIVSLV